MDQAVKRHVDFLDPVRGVAILLVFVYHSLSVAFNRNQLPWDGWFCSFDEDRSFLMLLPATYGWAGVAVFFVVSGFCIHLSFSRQPEWPVFFNRRFFRIYPPYLAALLFFALVFPLFRLHFTSAEDVWQFVSHLALFHNFGERWFFGTNPSFWSIAVEVQLYAIYPLLLVFTGRFGWRRTLVAIAALEITLRLTDGIMFTASGTGLPRWVSGSPFFFWFSWSLGACIAEWYVRGTSRHIPRGWLFLLGSMAVAFQLVKPLSSLTFPLFALLTAAVIAKLLHEPDSRLPLPRFAMNHLRNAGLWSYSLYLLHQPLLCATRHIVVWIKPATFIHPLVFFTICIASWFLIVPLGRLAYRFCEQPSISLGKRIQARNGVSQWTRRGSP